MKDKKHENSNDPKADLIAEILREYERCGDTMRYLNAKGPDRLYIASQVLNPPVSPRPELSGAVALRHSSRRQGARAPSRGW
jgi:hypothetical protein